MTRYIALDPTQDGNGIGANIGLILQVRYGHVLLAEGHPHLQPAS